MKRLSALIVAGGLCVGSVEARAADPSLVTLVRPSRPDGVVAEATTRLEAELRAAGFEVRVIDAAPGDGRTQVEGPDPRRAGPSFATIAILATDRGAIADVWVADHVTQKTLVRRVDVSDPGLANSASDLAVRSVELLRASLLEVSAPEKQELPRDLARWLEKPAPPPVVRSPLAARSERELRPRPPAPARAVPSQSVPGRATRASAELAVGFLGSTSFGAAVVPASIRVGYEVFERFAVRATFAPVLRSTLTAPEGTVALRQEIATLDVAYALGSPSATVFPAASLGRWIYHLRVDGLGRPPYVGEQHDIFAAFVSAGAGFGVRLHEGLAILVDVHALFLEPEPGVTIAGNVVGSTGRPAFLSLAGIVASF